jgi:hypothetical protein
LLYRGSIHRWRCSACLDVAIGLDRPPQPYQPDWAFRPDAPSASSTEVVYATSTGSTTREESQP